MGCWSTDPLSWRGRLSFPLIKIISDMFIQVITGNVQKPLRSLFHRYLWLLHWCLICNDLWEWTRLLLLLSWGYSTRLKSVYHIFMLRSASDSDLWYTMCPFSFLGWLFSFCIPIAQVSHVAGKKLVQSSWPVVLLEHRISRLLWPWEKLFLSCLLDRLWPGSVCPFRWTRRFYLFATINSKLLLIVTAEAKHKANLKRWVWFWSFWLSK